MRQTARIELLSNGTWCVLVYTPGQRLPKAHHYTNRFDAETHAQQVNGGE